VNLHHRIEEKDNEDERELRVEETIEAIKALNTAKVMLLEETAGTRLGQEPEAETMQEHQRQDGGGTATDSTKEGERNPQRESDRGHVSFS
jgi:hypothetical protein